MNFNTFSKQNQKLCLFFALFYCQINIVFSQSQPSDHKAFAIKSIYLRSAISFSNGNNKSLFPFEPTKMTGRDLNSYTQPTAGQFLMGSVGVGVMIHDNIGFESNLSYLYGLDQDIFDFQSGNTSVSAHRHDIQYLWNNSLVFTTKLQRFRPYIKVGLILPIHYTTSFHEVISDGTNINEYHYQISSERNLGLNGCVGVSYEINKKLSIFVETEEANVRTFYTKANLSDATITGQILSPNPAPNQIVFGENGFQRFPLSLQRETYSIGLIYNLGK